MAHRAAHRAQAFKKKIPAPLPIILIRLTTPSAHPGAAFCGPKCDPAQHLPIFYIKKYGGVRLNNNESVKEIPSIYSKSKSQRYQDASALCQLGPHQLGPLTVYQLGPLTNSAPCTVELRNVILPLPARPPVGLVESCEN